VASPIIVAPGNAKNGNIERKFVFGQRESREMGQLNRLQSQIDNMQGIKAQAERDQTAALTGAISGVAGAASKIDFSGG
jgi:hypothetical protein